MREQKILTPAGNYRELDEWLREGRAEKVLLVCGGSLRLLGLNRYFESLTARMGIQAVMFSDFHPNPSYESVVRGVKLFQEENCGAIIAVGGGSAMDVAKCIKLYSGMDGHENYLRQAIVPNDIPFLAVPTTAGSGSEATRYAVIYYEGAKQSVTDLSCVPSAVLMDSSALKTLPLYQKKSAMMDAFCHALESFWSVNSTAESEAYGGAAIRSIMANMDRYLENDAQAGEAMLLAANAAGRAINITQTTAGHAMCYKLTGLYGVAHGHAAALCDRVLFPWMIKNVGRCVDPRGEEHLRGAFKQIAEAMECRGSEEAADKFNRIFQKLGLPVPAAAEGDYQILKTSVNGARLKNHPMKLDMETIDGLYHQILSATFTGGRDES